MTTFTKLAALSNSEVVAHTYLRSNRLKEQQAELLMYLGEVDARKLYVEEGVNSLWSFCRYRLKYSEAEASRRVVTTRVLRQFPQLLGELQSGCLSLTALSLIAKHLTPDNGAVLIAKGASLSSRELEAYLVQLASAQQSPASMPVPKAVVRVVKPQTVAQDGQGSAPCAQQPQRSLFAEAASQALSVLNTDSQPASMETQSEREAGGASTAAARYTVKLTLTEEGYQALCRAQALAGSPADAEPNCLVVTALLQWIKDAEKRKFGVVKKEKVLHPSQDMALPNSPRSALSVGCDGLVHGQMAAPVLGSPKLSQIETAACVGTPEAQQAPRSISRATRRAVMLRDQGQCTYVAADGYRCSQKVHLEVDHILPRAAGGSHRLENLRLRCRTHNLHAATLFFGTRHMQQFIGTTP